jgi:hypothetical protein
MLHTTTFSWVYEEIYICQKSYNFVKKKVQNALHLHEEAQENGDRNNL